MKKTCLLVVCLTAPLVASPTACVNDTLTNYTNGVICTIGDKTFGGFGALLTALSVLGTATPASTDDITVKPSGDSANPAFSFVAAFNASTASLISASSVTFTVGYVGFAPINDPFTSTSLFLTNAHATGLGVITAAEALCKDGQFSSLLDSLTCNTTAVNAGLLVNNITNANLGATVTFNTGPVTTLGVIKQLTLTSGLGGSATADALNNSYTAAAVPEPGSFLLLAAGLGVIVRFRRSFPILR